MDIKINSERQFNRTIVTAYIDDFLLQANPHIKPVLNRLIEKILNQIIFIHYNELETHINNIISSKETRDFIEQEIRERIKIKIQEQVNNLFGNNE